MGPPRPSTTTSHVRIVGSPGPHANPGGLPLRRVSCGCSRIFSGLGESPSFMRKPAAANITRSLKGNGLRMCSILWPAALYVISTLALEPHLKRHTNGAESAIAEALLIIGLKQRVRSEVGGKDSIAAIAAENPRRPTPLDVMQAEVDIERRTSADRSLRICIREHVVRTLRLRVHPDAASKIRVDGAVISYVYHALPARRKRQRIARRVRDPIDAGR